MCAACTSKGAGCYGRNGHEDAAVARVERFGVAHDCGQIINPGEPTAAVVPSAIANGIYDATGARLRSVPFRPEKVKAALASA